MLLLTLTSILRLLPSYIDVLRRAGVLVDLNIMYLLERHVLDTVISIIKSDMETSNSRRKM